MGQGQERVVGRGQGRVVGRGQGRVVGRGWGGADKLRINSRKVGCLEQHIYFWEKIFFKFVNLFFGRQLFDPIERGTK